MKPIIGVVEWPYFDKDGDLIYEVPNQIVEQISKHGGIPVGIFPTQIADFQNKRLSEIDELTVSEKEDIVSSLRRVDAIIKPGAIKVYGFERLMYEYAFERDIPYLGICAGMQMMAAYQNDEVKNVKIENGSHRSDEKYAHSIKIARGTLLYNILKSDIIMVNSRHSYSISSPGIHMVSAISDDGVIEGIEARDKKFNIGVQWHPESLNDQNTDNLFGEFIEAAKRPYSL